MKLHPSPFRRKLGLWLIGLSVGVSGCGFLLSHGPPDGHETMTSFNCTESNVWPVLDVVWAGLNVAATAAIASNPDNYYDPEIAIASGVTWVAISGVSAAVGFTKSARCRDAKRQLAERQSPAGGPIPEAQRDTTVGEAPIQAIMITPKGDTLYVGYRVQLTATAYRPDGAIIADLLFAWSASDDAVASVTSAGLVSALAPGMVVVSARAQNAVGMAHLLVVPHP